LLPDLRSSITMQFRSSMATVAFWSVESNSDRTFLVT
jgi:hypothetical protein